MGALNPNFRPNPQRAIHVYGKIDSSQVHRLTPEILTLRHQSNDPITVYINSPGGFTSSLDLIHGLLTSPDVDGKHPRIITVAAGSAKSAAADLLTFGDYAYACRHASILFHGVRFQPDEALTVQETQAVGRSLESSNERMALRLAEASIDRMVLQFALNRKQFDRIRTENPPKKNAPILNDLECFVYALKGQTQSEWAHDALERAKKRCAVIAALSDYVFPKLKRKEKDTPASFECKIMRLILDYELTSRKNEDWQLDGEGLAQVVEDYMLLRDFYIGSHNKKLSSIIKRHGTHFLTKDELQTHGQLASKPKEEIQAWLRDKTAIRVQGFWYFAVSLWRELQQEENSIVPHDAYLLGAIDEVMGTKAPCFRIASENNPDSTAPAPSLPSASPPPSEQSAPSGDPTKTQP